VSKIVETIPFDRDGQQKKLKNSMIKNKKNFKKPQKTG